MTRVLLGGCVDSCDGVVWGDGGLRACIVGVGQKNFSNFWLLWAPCILGGGEESCDSDCKFVDFGCE